MIKTFSSFFFPQVGAYLHTSEQVRLTPVLTGKRDRDRGGNICEARPAGIYSTVTGRPRGEAVTFLCIYVPTCTHVDVCKYVCMYVCLNAVKSSREVKLT